MENEDFMNIDMFDTPIPGESLTNDPSTPKPWEQPPEFTDVDEAIKEIFLLLTDGEKYIDFLDALREEVPVDMLAQILLFNGYTKGKWNTDLMYLLIEPTVYVMIALAEHNGIFDYVLYDGEETDLEDDEIVNLLEDDIKRMQPKKKISGASKNVIPDSLLAKIEELPVAEQASAENEGEM